MVEGGLSQEPLPLMYSLLVLAGKGETQEEGQGETEEGEEVDRVTLPHLPTTPSRRTTPAIEEEEEEGGGEEGYRTRDPRTDTRPYLRP